MDVFQTRLDSFLKAKRIKPTAGKSRSVSIKWPHPSHFLATPNSLAEAGFYFCPTWEDRDAVKCYMCGKELSEWLEDDDPFAIHWNKCRTLCPWAAVRCGIPQDMDQDRNFVFPDPMRVPSSEHMRKARLRTFTNWPHDSDEPHGANSERMALAGFVYTPQSLRDDTATCLYCNTALSGWEIDDDPLQEHRKRDEKSKLRCPLFVDDTQPTSNKPPARNALVTKARKTKEITKKSKNDNELRELESGSTEPSLSSTLVNKIGSVTEAEMDMTVEEWIRHEMDLQYGLFKADGEKMIDSFKEKTIEIKDLSALKQFSFDRVLSEDPVTLLGSFPKTGNVCKRQPAILRIEKAALSTAVARDLCQKFLERVELVGTNDIYTWLFGWLGPERDKDIKILVISPATAVHIRKYTTQEQIIVRETPTLYLQVVKPYIDAFPPSRIQWIEDVLSGQAESHKVLFNDPCQQTGFMILPDMKWDLNTLSSLYLVAITRSKDIHCLRDLRRKHLGILRNIRRQAAQVIKSKWNLEAGKIRLFIHYQPSYYHFHVHIVNADWYGSQGMVVGQAHLLDDVISLLELDPEDGPSVFERMTLTYGLGDQHGLFSAMKAAQAEL